ncbi:MAG TPA: serine/threonine-protein kinase [Candidatus Acidoferrales bacterium]
MASGKLPSVFETASESYSVQAVQGEGGTANVFRVVDSESKQWALKCLKPEHVTTSRTKRFFNELHFCRNSQHKNVIRVVDEGFIVRGTTKCPFYVMPFYGSTLRAMITKGLPVGRGLYYFSQVLDGVEAAHLQRVWHRDLKPENILHDPVGDTAAVADFGIAHFAAEDMHATVKTRPHERLANLQYAAPEQNRRGEPVDQRADIYALGLILNEMFTGHVPQGEGFRRISDVLPEYGYLDEIVDQMRQNRPENRPGSIDEIKRMLISHQNEFIQRQKLDQLRRTVVPSTTVSHPLLADPPYVRHLDIEGNTLVLTLSQPVSSEWIEVFRKPRSMGYPSGTGPHEWNLQALSNYARATVRLPPHYFNNPATTQSIIDNFKNWVEFANKAFREGLERAARAKEEEEKRLLSEKIAAEERRQRLLQGIKV